MVIMYNGTFGITIPPLNFQLFLYVRTSKASLYRCRLTGWSNLSIHIVEFGFTYPSPQSGRRRATSHPETQLMALVIVATKLLFPFDSGIVERYPKSLNDAGVIRLDWEEWLNAKMAFDEATSSANSDAMIKGGAKMALKDTDILELTDDGLDEYMDWYQGMWINTDRTEEGVQKRVLDMFPVETLQELSRDEVVTRGEGTRRQVGRN